MQKNKEGKICVFLQKLLLSCLRRCRADASLAIISAAAFVTLAAALALLCADNRETVFHPVENHRCVDSSRATQPKISPNPQPNMSGGQPRPSSGIGDCGFKITFTPF